MKRWEMAKMVNTNLAINCTETDETDIAYVLYVNIGFALSWWTEMLECRNRTKLLFVRLDAVCKTERSVLVWDGT